jgi:sigma-B regulation protein RsbU (phosphoserine phosphatase)
MKAIAHHNPSAPPIRVLLVEDNAGDAFLLGELLSDAPITFQIETVTRLAHALVRLNAPGIDVVLSDLSLPDSQGIETFHRLAAHPSRLPIIVLSGLNDEALALRTVEEGAQDYLVKGLVDQALLVRAIRYALKRAEADRAFHAERNLLRSVVDNLPDSVYVKDAQGRYLLGNLAHTRQLGLQSPEEAVGKRTADFFPPEIARHFEEDDAQVLRSGQPIVNRHESAGEVHGEMKWLSTTKVPLRDAAGKIVGIVGIGRDITARKLAEEKLAKYTAELKEKNAEMEDDLNMAREVQQAFLPQQFPSFPQGASTARSTLRFFSRYLPTTTLGGDFFHVVPISDTQAGVFICDVMGHGVRAALVTAIQRTLVEDLQEFASEPGTFLSRMNHGLLAILRRSRSPMFASAFYLVLDVGRGSLRYANAGHPRPLHLRRDAGVLNVLGIDLARPGPALGVFDDTVYTTHETTIAAHDLVMLFTDGLYEVENREGQLFDQNLLVEAVQSRLQHGTEQLFDETLAAVRGFSGLESFVDDVCLVAVEVEHVGDREPA